MRWLFKLYNKSHVKNSKALFDLMEFPTQCHTKNFRQTLQRFRQQRDTAKLKSNQTKSGETERHSNAIQAHCLHGLMYTRKIFVVFARI